MRHFLTLFLFLLISPLASAEMAGDISGDASIEIEADQVEYDELTGNVIATGDVLIEYNNHLLQAEKIIYNRKTEIFHAVGSINIEDFNSGNIYLATEASINKDFSYAEVQDITALLEPKGSFWADTAWIQADEIFTARNAKYTMCKLCESNLIANKALWSINTKTLTHNSQTNRVKFNHAFINLYDVPVMYTPYLSMPTPGAKRQSGLLYPYLRWDSKFGTNIKIPFYFNLKPNMDLTVTPWLMQNFGQQISAKFRHMTKHGQYSVLVSRAKNDKTAEDGTSVPGNSVRSHIDANGLFKVQNSYINGTLGFKILKMHDDLDTYLKRYNINNDDVLTSEVFFNHFAHNNYYTINALHFQGLREIDDENITPQVYPAFEGYYKHNIADNLNIDFLGNFLNLYRSEGVNMQRGVFQTKLEKNNIFHGHRIDLFGSARADFYNVNIANPEGATLTHYLTTRGLSLDATEGKNTRHHSTIGAKWNYPLIKKSEQYTSTLTPQIIATFSPKLSQDNNFVNEDSQTPEISIDTLFTDNIFKGYDKIQDGNWLHYSLKSFTNFSRRKVGVEVGQAYRSNTSNDFLKNTGLLDNFSDILSRIDLSFDDVLTLSNKMRLSKDNASIQTNEFSAKGQYNKFLYKLDFYALSASLIENREVSHKKELKASLGYKLSKDWESTYKIHTKVGERVGEGRKLIAQGLYLVYKGDCLHFDFSVKKDYTKFQDLKPTLDYQFRINVPIL